MKEQQTDGQIKIDKQVDRTTENITDKTREGTTLNVRRNDRTLDCQTKQQIK